jgi:hypothetical protein
VTLHKKWRLGSTVVTVLLHVVNYFSFRLPSSIYSQIRTTVYVATLLSMVEEIDGPQARDDAIAELRNFAIVRAFPFAPFSFVELLQENPFKFPLKGFPGATKEFDEIWSIVRQIINCLFLLFSRNHSLVDVRR